MPPQDFCFAFYSGNAQNLLNLIYSFKFNHTSDEQSKEKKGKKETQKESFFSSSTTLIKSQQTSNMILVKGFDPPAPISLFNDAPFPPFMISILQVLMGTWHLGVEKFTQGHFSPETLTQTSTLTLTLMQTLRRNVSLRQMFYSVPYVGEFYRDKQWLILVFLILWYKFFWFCYIFAPQPEAVKGPYSHSVFESNNHMSLKK